MSGPHGRGGRRAADSPVHRLPARTKLVALVVFVVAVVAAPPGAWWVYGVAATALALAVILARLDVTTVVRGLAIEIPFVVFALALPFVATGPRVAVPGLPDVTVSTHGLSAAATFLARATLGTLAAVVLASTTSPAHLVGGLRLLRLPGALVDILSFMVRYLDVVTGQWRRMAVARAARGFDARDVRSWPVLATSAGGLFVRSYERGERVHLAMLSRGGGERLPADPDGATTRRWAAALALPAVVVLASLTARVAA